MKRRAHILHETLAGCVQVSFAAESAVQQRAAKPVVVMNA